MSVEKMVATEAPKMSTAGMAAARVGLLAGAGLLMLNGLSMVLTQKGLTWPFKSKEK